MITNKLGTHFRNGYQGFDNWRNYSNSRKQAIAFRKEVVKRKGRTFVDKKCMYEIKRYAKEQFGSAGYWPWLTLYAEIREGFSEGWIPDDYYKIELLPDINPRTPAMVSTVKSLDHRLFKGFAIEPLGVRVSGRFYDAGQNGLEDAAFLERLRAHDSEVVMKRDGAPSGGGLVFKHAGDIRLSDFESRYNYVIQPSVKQHDSMNMLYDGSVNTIRVITWLADEHTDTASVIFTALRFGVNGSRLDNVDSGGRFFILDEQGRADTNAYDDLGFDAGTRHPNTGFRYRDLRVPSFGDAVEKCKESHCLFPYVRLIAWDVFIDESGNPGLIEWNARYPGIWGVEALFGPLMPFLLNRKQREGLPVSNV